MISSARQLLVSFRSKLEESGFHNIPGGNTPSSGFVGVYTMLQACSNVTVYGFGLDRSDGKSQEYHYFHILSPKSNKKKNSMNPTHSFDTEKLLLRSMADQGQLTFCGVQPGERKLRRSCGLKDLKAKKNQVAADDFDLLSIN